jgi:DNA-binding NtrC family response regulator
MTGPSPHRILVVDDDDDIRANLADILNDLGYVVSTASDGPAALKCVHESDFDVVILDFKMPGVDGATLYGEIKHVRPSIAAIMVTAYAGSDGVKRAVEAGTWDVLQKPVNIAELLSKIDQASKSPLVLIVDDDEGFCQTLWQILNQHHYRVALAYNEEEGIRQVNERRHQVVLVDLHLGSGHGRGVLEQINSSKANTPTILISGHDHTVNTMLSEFGDRGIQAVCIKPINIDHLLDTIAGLVT